ncbi:uncharacterized protein PGRI_006990 [Penicillium griseofulvum]|uniref:Uncharacterized protein n=1 Tax=Penicillium patulum TaxID=5078 RepID=A0A135LXF4_PENPA|nr:uncharacterized protein PGRI_006990 [Penicillium griseofulvum]KXG53649.1 hypothetical protein PGRI_006990 [Penicillium griseofulvum]
MSSSSACTSSFGQVCAHSVGFYSTSSTSSPFNGSVVDEMGFLKSALRAGGPYLCSLPAHTVDPVLHYGAATTHQIEGYAAQVLCDLQLQYQGIRLVGRHSKVDPEPQQVTTVLVRIPNQPQPELWLRAAKDVHQLLQRHHYDRISVELIETDMFNGIYCLPVESSHSIVPKWENIVHQIMTRYPNKDEWVGLDCFRHGTSTNWSSNPVTVIIRVSKTSEKSFDADARDVHDILAEFGEAGVDVLFMKDATQPYVRAVPFEATTGSVYPGVSIGIHQSSAACSTLGGFVQLRFKDQTDWNTYAVTCFHCVYSPEVHHGDHRIDHPAPQDLRTTIASLNQSIEDLKDDYFYTSKAEIDKGKDGWLSDSARHGYEATLKWIRRLKRNGTHVQKCLTMEHTTSAMSLPEVA